MKSSIAITLSLFASSALTSGFCLAGRPTFAGASKVARQRLIYKALSDELAGPIHALSVKALAPGEDS